MWILLPVLMHGLFTRILRELQAVRRELEVANQLAERPPRRPEPPLAVGAGSSGAAPVGLASAGPRRIIGVPAATLPAMKDQPKPPGPPEFSAATLKRQVQAATERLRLAVVMARELDWLGAASGQPEGSEAQALARVRYDLDVALAHCFRDCGALLWACGLRTRSEDLLLTAIQARRGEGDRALWLMRR